MIKAICQNERPTKTINSRSHGQEDDNHNSRLQISNTITECIGNAFERRGKDFNVICVWNVSSNYELAFPIFLLKI